MTLGTFLPLSGLFSAVVLTVMMLGQLRRLPGSTDPGYDPAQVAGKARSMKIVIAAALALPVLLYLAFNVLLPDDGAMVLF